MNTPPTPPTDDHPMPPVARISPDRGEHAVRIVNSEPEGVLASPVAAGGSAKVVASLFDMEGLSLALVGSAFTQHEMVSTLIDVIREGTPEQKLKAIKYLVGYSKEVLTMNGHVGKIELKQQETQNGTEETVTHTTKKILSFGAIGEQAFDVKEAKGVVKHEAIDASADVALDDEGGSDHEGEP